MYRCGAYCAAVVDWSGRTAPLFYCWAGGFVGGWVLDGGRFVGDRSRPLPDGGES